MAPVIVITGPTASGKSALALDLAERYNGEIICADSRTIYRGMDIGTAKPTKVERGRVLHHLLDVVEPDERYTAADFQTDANRAIDAAHKRGHLPFLVGGTGLYIDAVVREYEWPEWSDDELKRAELETKDVSELQTMIKNQHLLLPANSLNKRHLMNILMRGEVEGSARLLPRENITVVAIATDKSVLEQRICERAVEMFDQGVIEETKVLAEHYGWDSEAMKSNIYPIIKQHIDGEITQQQAIDLFVIKDRQLAKRQVTWLKRHDYVQWHTLESAKDYLEHKLSS